MKTWGYILEMPGRPDREDQIAVMRAFGVQMGKGQRPNFLFSDKLDKAKRHRTAGQTQLEQRNDLIMATMPKDTVIVADPMCLGVSPSDAEWFLTQLAAKNVRVTVNGDLYDIAPGDTTADVVAEFARRLNNFNSAKSKGRIQK